MIVIECDYFEPHTHEFPDDWIFGGPDGLDPRYDPRWVPTTYEYFNDKIQRIDITQAPLCDNQAIDEFTKVAGYGPGFNPVWLFVTRGGYGEGERTSLPVVYNRDTDEVSDK